MMSIVLQAYYSSPCPRRAYPLANRLNPESPLSALILSNGTAPERNCKTNAAFAVEKRRFHAILYPPPRDPVSSQSQSGGKVATERVRSHSARACSSIRHLGYGRGLPGSLYQGEC